jgi:hypothetical protein
MPLLLRLWQKRQAPNLTHHSGGLLVAIFPSFGIIDSMINDKGQQMTMARFELMAIRLVMAMAVVVLVLDMMYWRPM